MPTITREYVDSLPQIYQDILRSYVIFHSQQHLGAGVALPSLYAALHEKYTPSQVRVACERMAEAGVLEFRDEIWTHPTILGQDLISQLTQGMHLPEDEVPPFSPPPPQA